MKNLIISLIKLPKSLEIFVGRDHSILFFIFLLLIIPIAERSDGMHPISRSRSSFSDTKLCDLRPSVYITPEILAPILSLFLFLLFLIAFLILAVWIYARRRDSEKN